MTWAGNEIRVRLLLSDTLLSMKGEQIILIVLVTNCDLRLQLRTRMMPRYFSIGYKHVE